MRKIIFGLSLFSAFILLTGMGGGVAESFQKDPIVIEQNGPNDPSLCDTIAGNLVGNCGFESGLFSPWVQSGDLSATFISPDMAHSGNQNLWAGPVQDLGFITQNLATSASATYSLHMWMAHLSTNQANRFQVSWAGTVIADASNLPQSPYTEYCFGDLAPTGTSTALRIGYYEAPSYFLVDDISVTAQ